MGPHAPLSFGRLSYRCFDRLSYLMFSLLRVTGILALSSCGNPIADQEEMREELGHRLFFDTRLSFNNTKSCASCHDPALAFTDGYRRSITASGDMTLRNAPSLINISGYKYYDWADPGIVTLEQQHLRPLFGQDPIELGAKENEEKILLRLNNDGAYKKLFRAAFPEKTEPVTLENSIFAIAAYIRSLQSLSSPYDFYIAGDSNALNASERRGMQLFFSGRTQCASCHPPPLFTLAGLSSNIDSVYRNTGLYNIGNKGYYPVSDPGLAARTGNPDHDGKFKIPSLRNVSLTSPYMHDGSVRSLTEVLAIYKQGGRILKEGPMAGDGRKHPGKDPRISGFDLSSDEKDALVDFLYALTDTTLSSRPQFKNPFKPTPSL